jgi:hypothetical protein
MARYALNKARELARRSSSRARHEIAKREHTMYTILASSLLGIAEGRGHYLPVVFGLDGTLVAGTAAVLLADAASGGMQRFLQSFGDGMLAIGSYKMGRSVGGKPIQGVSDVQAIEAVLGS